MCFPPLPLPPKTPKRKEKMLKNEKFKPILGRLKTDQGIVPDTVG